MENMSSTAAVSGISTASAPRLSNRAGSVATACAGLLLAALKGAWRAYTDPNTCSMYWIGSHPSLWGAKGK
jgi:hypothetical protein